MPLAFFALGCGIGNGGAQDRQASKPQRAKALGYVGAFKGGGPIAIADSREDYVATAKAIVAEDNIGLDKLESSKSYFTVPDGTRAKVIDSQDSLIRVRLLSGEYKDDDGWTDEVFLK